MKIRLIDVTSPRSDDRKGGPTGVTLNKVYNVAEVLDTQYSIINDEYKIARYSQHRFEVVDDSPVKPLRNAFNELTQEMRMELNALRKENKILKNTQGQEASQALNSLKSRLDDSYIEDAAEVGVVVGQVYDAIDVEKANFKAVDKQGN